MGQKRIAQPKIEFTAAVYKVQTLVDGGIRITLDLPETSIPQAAMLMECKRDEIPLRFDASVLLNNKDQYAISEGNKRKSKWETAQESNSDKDS